MIYNRNRLIKRAEKVFFDQWKAEKLVDDTIPGNYFSDAYKSQNRWGWIFSFILTLIATAASFGFVMMLTGFDLPAVPVALSVIAAVLFLQRRDEVSSGEVAAAILIAGGAAISFLPVVLEKDPGNIYWGISGIVSFVILTRRYASSVALLMTFLFACYLLFTMVEKYVSAAFLPFIFMAFSGSLYLFSERMFHGADIIWKPKVLLVRMFSLVTLILSGNYYVVRSLSESLLGTAGEIRFSYFFYLFSTAFPMFIIYYALKRKLRPELICGILGVIVGVLGIRAYHSIMPLEYALLLSGLVLFVVGYLTVLGLKQPVYGLSVESSSADGKLSKVNEMILAFATKNDLPSQAADTEGGGQFGGGGAGSKF